MHGNFIENGCKLYSETRIHDIPDINFALCQFLEIFLEVIYTDPVISYFKHQKIKGWHIMSISNQLQLLNQYPTNVQYILCEILFIINENEKNTLKFIFNKMNKMIKYKLIDSSWASEFIELACRPPFVNVLNRYYNSSGNIREDLMDCTYKIILIELPKGLSGFNAHNGSIVIKLYKNELCAKAATFIVYLHEVSHFLQRLEYQTINDHYNNFSVDNGHGDEGSNSLEEILFGSVLDFINTQTSQFLFSGELPESLEEFSEQFKTLNQKKGGKGNSILLKKFSNSLHIGSCGFIKRKLRTSK